MKALLIKYLPAVALLIPTVAWSQERFFNAVYSRDALDVLAVADSGLFYRSLSGGVQWTRTALGDKPLRDVVARDWSIVVVGDEGKIFRSTDLGGTWTVASVEGGPSLRRVEWRGGEDLVAVGSGGTLLTSADWGATWSAAASGTVEQLNAVRFVDSQNGWVAGTNGYLARTTDGGASWTPVGLGTAQHLNGVDASGGAVWVVGDNATAFRSVNDGTDWEQLNLHADAWPDVKGVWAQSADTVLITGGGGFIRRSVDGGTTWSFQAHELQGQIADLYFRGPNGWAASSRQRAVLRTSDGGATWSLPAGTTTTRTWALKRAIQSGSVVGSNICLSPAYKNTLYAALGNWVYRSRDDGETWSYIATIGLPGRREVRYPAHADRELGGPAPPNPGTGRRVVVNRTNAFVVSAKDSNHWVAAVQSDAFTLDRVMWTDDAGATWNDGYVRNFGEYGIPLEADPDRPDTMYFGVDSYQLLRSIDRGKTWSEWSSTTFRSPCDIVVVPGSDSALILLGDGITNSGNGRYWRNASGSGAFTDQGIVVGSEIPGIACSRLRNSVAFGTNWSSGGVQRTTDYGLTWSRVHTANSTWGVDIARDDPDVVIFGLYAGSAGLISFTGGDSGSFAVINGLTGSNYGFYARDRATILAQQSGGIYKLVVSQTLPLAVQGVAVTSPNGGEVWEPGTVQDITWSANDLVMARIEYRPGIGEPWQMVADVEGTAGRYAWTVPTETTADGRIRVSDAWDTSPSDTSDAAFTIGTPGSPAGVTHRAGTAGSATGDAVVTAFALWPNRPNPFTQQTVIRYALPTVARVSLEVFDVKGGRVAVLVDGEQGPGEHSVSFGSRAGGGRAFPAGIYFCRMRTGSFSAVRRMVLMH